jgi:hypothetical protein
MTYAAQVRLVIAVFTDLDQLVATFPEQGADGP